MHRQRSWLSQATPHAIQHPIRYFVTAQQNGSPKIQLNTFQCSGWLLLHTVHRCAVKISVAATSEPRRPNKARWLTTPKNQLASETTPHRWHWETPIIMPWSPAATKINQPSRCGVSVVILLPRHPGAPDVSIQIGYVTRAVDAPLVPISKWR